MVAINKCRQLALGFEGVVEEPHFEKTAFKVNKKIFATLDLVHQRLVIKLLPVDQSVFCAFDKTIIYPVAGSWGKKGWTTIELKMIMLPMLKDALTTAYCTIAPAYLAKQYKSL